MSESPGSGSRSGSGSEDGLDPMQEPNAGEARFQDVVRKVTLGNKAAG